MILLNSGFLLFCSVFWIRAFDLFLPVSVVVISSSVVVEEMK